MMKKAVASTIVLVILGTSNVLTYANTVDKNIQNQTVSQSFTLINPDRDVTTSDKSLLFHFTAPEGTIVTISVYHNISINASRENYVLSYDPIEVRVGALQRGWAEVELRQGLNRIEFTATNRNGLKDAVTRIITVKDMNEVRKSVESNIANRSAVDTIRDLVNSPKK